MSKKREIIREKRNERINNEKESVKNKRNIDASTDSERQRK
jgi:hypothetical protein